MAMAMPIGILIPRNPILLILLLTSLVIQAAPSAEPATPDNCLGAIPPEVADARVTDLLTRIGLRAQAELSRVLLASGRLDAVQQAQVRDFPATDAAPPATLDIHQHALHLTDYDWYARQRPIIPEDFCRRLVIRTHKDCGAWAANLHNLLVTYLRNRAALCAPRADWSPPRDALPIVQTIAEVIAAPAYYAALQDWLEADPKAFRQPETLFTLLYLDYLNESFEHRRIGTAYREFLLRRTDLRERYPMLESVKRQLGRMKDLGLLE
jgi:hypothetical protein